MAQHMFHNQRDNFFRKWGVQHVTGIPHFPTGQAIIERTHQTLKHYLQKQKQGESWETPVNRLMEVQYVMNFLRLAGEDVIPPVVKHVQGMLTGMSTHKKQLKVLVKNKEGKWEGSFQLVTWGRGYACVISDSGPTWILAKWVKPAVEKGTLLDGSSLDQLSS